MNLSVELTMTPISDDYRNHIVDFIKALRNSEFVVRETPLSTQIFGEYDALMMFLTEQIKISFENQEKVLVYMKIVKSDRSNYEPDF